MTHAPIRKAVFPAAGLGTRFLPATKAQPKEMLPLVDKPIIQYVVEEAVASGIANIIIITGRGKTARGFLSWRRTFLKPLWAFSIRTGRRSGPWTRFGMQAFPTT